MSCSRDLAAAISLKGFEPLAGKIRTQTAMQDTFFVRAGSDLAVGTACMDVKRSRAAALTGESLWVATPTSRLRSQTLARVERCPVMVAGSTVEAARCQ